MRPNEVACPVGSRRDKPRPIRATQDLPARRVEFDQIGFSHSSSLSFSSDGGCQRILNRILAGHLIKQPAAFSISNSNSSKEFAEGQYDTAEAEAAMKAATMYFKRRS